jgi:predicted nucleic acid-binding Zn ribbon protein
MPLQWWCKNFVEDRKILTCQPQEKRRNDLLRFIVMIFRMVMQDSLQQFLLPHKHMVVGSNPIIATNVVYFKRCSSAVERVSKRCLFFPFFISVNNLFPDFGKQCEVLRND